MQGPPGALGFVLAHGMPATIEVVGGSMEPSLARGVKVDVEPVAPGASLAVGDLVVLTTDDPDVLLLHRVMHLFSERGRRFVIHQGDAPSSKFAVCPRDNVDRAREGAHRLESPRCRRWTAWTPAPARVSCGAGRPAWVSRPRAGLWAPWASGTTPSFGVAARSIDPSRADCRAEARATRRAQRAAVFAADATDSPPSAISRRTAAVRQMKGSIPV